jgi:hypothetical protein
MNLRWLLTGAITVAVTIVIGVSCASSRGAAAASDGDRNWESHDASRRARLSRWIGCYSVEAGLWSGDTSSTRPPRLKIPTEVRLDIARQDGYLALRPLPDSASGFTTAGWSASGPNPLVDTLLLTWQEDAHVLFSAQLVATLVREGNAFRGRLEPVSDMRPFVAPSLELRLTRGKCARRYPALAT